MINDNALSYKSEGLIHRRLCAQSHLQWNIEFAIYELLIQSYTTTVCNLTRTY